MKLYALFHCECDEEGTWTDPYLVGVYSSKKNAQNHKKAIEENWMMDSLRNWDSNVKFSQVNRVRIRPYNLNESDEMYMSL